MTDATDSAEADADEGTPEDLNRLQVNMNRWRWMPEDLGTRYVWLNIPEFTLRVMKDGTAIHSEKAVVGSSANPTPVLSADLKSIEFHPYRVVPSPIIRRTGADPTMMRGHPSRLRHFFANLCLRSAQHIAQVATYAA